MFFEINYKFKNKVNIQVSTGYEYMDSEHHKYMYKS